MQFSVASLSYREISSVYTILYGARRAHAVVKQRRNASCMEFAVAGFWRHSYRSTEVILITKCCYNWTRYLSMRCCMFLEIFFSDRKYSTPNGSRYQDDSGDFFSALAR
jgi:hypothetical protein